MTFKDFFQSFLLEYKINNSNNSSDNKWENILDGFDPLDVTAKLAVAMGIHQLYENPSSRSFGNWMAQWTENWDASNLSSEEKKIFSPEYISSMIKQLSSKLSSTDKGICVSALELALENYEKSEQVSQQIIKYYYDNYDSYDDIIQEILEISERSL